MVGKGHYVENGFFRISFFHFFIFSMKKSVDIAAHTFSKRSISYVEMEFTVF